MRRCQVTYQEWDKEENKFKDSTTRPAVFHEWSSEADGDGESNPIGIVELDNGQVITEYPRNITFDEPETNEVKERELSARVFMGSNIQIEADLRGFLDNVKRNQIFKVLQSECALDGDKFITVTIFYYKESL